MNQSKIDFLRTMVISQGFSIYLLTAWVVVRYLKALSMREWRTNKTHWENLAFITTYLLAMTYICFSIIDHMGGVWTWRLPFAFITFTIGIISLVVKLGRLKDEIDSYRF